MHNLDEASNYIEAELPNCIWQFGLIKNPHHITTPIGPGISVTIVSPDGTLRIWEKAPMGRSILPTVYKAVNRMRQRLEGDSTA